MLSEQGVLKRHGKSQELLDIIARYGGRGMDFIWRHKGVLATATVLTAFIANPDPYINGAVKLVETVGDDVTEGVTRPLAEGAAEVSRQTNWTLLGIITVLLLALPRIVRTLCGPRPRSISN